MPTPKPSLTSQYPEDSLDPSGRRNSGHQIFGPITWLVGFLLISIIGLMIPLPDGGRILPKLGDMAHAPLFAGITAGMVMAWNYLRPPTGWNQFATRLVFISILTFGFGGLTEVTQGLTGRTASLHDLAADSCGIAAACCFLIAGTSRRIVSLTKNSILLLLLVGAGCIVFSWLSPLASINDALAMKREFPLLASFERDAELERWHFANCHARRVHRTAHSGNFVETDDGVTTDGNWAMEVSYQPGSHSSATMYEMQADWTQGAGLVVDAFALKDPTVPGGTIEIAVQIIDAHHGEQFQDICRKVFVLVLGKTTRLQIPKEEWITIKGRPLDLEQILYLDLQLASRPAVATVCFDTIQILLDQEQQADELTARVAR